MCKVACRYFKIFPVIKRDIYPCSTGRFSTLINEKDVSAIISWLGCLLTVVNFWRKKPWWGRRHPTCGNRDVHRQSPPSHHPPLQCIGNWIVWGPTLCSFTSWGGPQYSCTNSRSGSKPDWVCMGLGGGPGRRERCFNRQGAACAWAPEPQHLPCFAQGLISSSAVSPMLRQSSTSGPHQLMSLLLLMWLLLCVLQSFWGPYRWSSTRRRKVRTWDVARRTSRLCSTKVNWGMDFKTSIGYILWQLVFLSSIQTYISCLYVVVTIAYPYNLVQP